MAVGITLASCTGAVAAASARHTWLDLDTTPLTASTCNQSADPAQMHDALVDAWFEDVDRLVVKYQQNPLRAARAYAYVAVAMRDAWFLSVAKSCDGSIAAEAAHLTAGRVMEFLYPQESSMLWTAVGYARSRSAHRGSTDGAVTTDGGVTTSATASPSAIATKVTDSVVAAVRRRMLIDGAELRPAPTTPSREVGQWQGTAPLYAPLPLEPTADRWLPWSTADIRNWRAPKPPAVDSEAYRTEVRAVLDANRKLTDQERAIADRWHLDQGSVTPVGVWNRIARDELRASKLATRQRVDTLAQLHVAMFDAFVATWHTKLTYNTERPITAIRRMHDPGFLPYLATPQFPSYVSGHAAASGAADVVLSQFLPAKAATFHAMAAQAADSRLYGGIHFPIDNSEGLALGRRVAQHVVETAPVSAIQ